MTKTPDSDAMRSAALWLQQNEGDDEERAPMLLVAEWLEKQADAKDVRDAARLHGVPVSALLARMTGALAKSPT